MGEMIRSKDMPGNLFDMKKSDLKTGMIVELRNGEECVAFIDACETQYMKENYSNHSKHSSVLVNSKEKTWLDLNSYNENMIYTSFCSREDIYDIMKVYVPSHQYAFMDVSYDKEHRNLIWDRDNPMLETTMEKLEYYFGCKIKIV